MTKAIELLAPAKNLEVGMAAIEAGADAVYIGGPSFGARKAAGNSLTDIAQLVRFAHLYDVRVLVTLNTLLRDDEMKEAVGLAYEYRRIGVDAIIIQDMNLARILFDSGHFSGEDGGIRLHASTQCDNRSLERVQQLEQMGFRRVVLARELSYEQMRTIREHTHCELEAFVHGALCVSYSGACYLSEAVCGRSANRGECAQLCRLAYDVLDQNQQPLLQHKHILSLRDLNRSQSLQELLDAGITTLKIEGRLKDIDYVRNVVAYYRQLLDSMGVKHTSAGVCATRFVPNPEKTFHRGSTDYFSYGRPASLVNQDTPKSTGELLGYAPIDTSVLHNGDGLTFDGQGCYWPARLHLPAGTPVYRNYDAEFQRQLAAKDACTRVLPVHICFHETEIGCELTMSVPPQSSVLPQSIVSPPEQGEELVGGFNSLPLREGRGGSSRDSVKVLFPFMEEAEAGSLPTQGGLERVFAQNPARAEAMVIQQLSKLGGTGLEATQVIVDWQHPLFLTAAQLNDMRRQLVDAFISMRTTLTTPLHPDLPPFKGGPGRGFPEFSEGRIPRELMTCRYCILHELGKCRKQSPSSDSVPTYLRMPDSRFGLLRIVTHCAATPCYMTIEKA